jgi:hypothetical protein
MSMRISRVFHAGFCSIALAVAMIGLGGGCGDSAPPSGTVLKEDPGAADARAKNISAQYGAGGTQKAKAAPAPAPAPVEKKP